MATTFDNDVCAVEFKVRAANWEDLVYDEAGVCKIPEDTSDLMSWDEELRDDVVEDDEEDESGLGLD